ncbi:hypothetical protein HYS48_02635 [Candidatus Woesearchaeota archaeon]|nr:hypothetical protein [Candidatus Woesearchaeota archaeon]
MKKRGQVTFFVILGIFLLVVVGLFYAQLEREMAIKAPPSLSFDRGAIQQYVESCIASIGEEALQWIGEHSGYFELPTEAVTGSPLQAAYYFYLDKDLMPSKERIEQEISRYLDEELFFCLKNFADFPGMYIIPDEVATTATILDESVLFEVRMPLRIQQEASETKISLFRNEMRNIRLHALYAMMRAFMDEQMKNPASVCLSCLLKLGIQYDVHIAMQRLDDDVVLFTLTDAQSKIDDQPYRFVFANKYKLAEMTP